MLVAVALLAVCVRASTVHCIHLYRQFDPLAMLVRSRLNSLKKYSGVLRMLVPWENATPELLQEELAMLQDLQQSMQIMPSAAEFMPCASPFYAVELLQDRVWSLPQQGGHPRRIARFERHKQLRPHAS